MFHEKRITVVVVCGEERSCAPFLGVGTTSSITENKDTSITDLTFLNFRSPRACDKSVNPTVHAVMFPRGVGNLEEVPQNLVSHCILSDDLPGTSQDAGVSAICDTVAQAGIG